MKNIVTLVFLLSLSAAAMAAQNTSLQDGIASLQKQWAVAVYKTPKTKQNEVFGALTHRAESLSQIYPDAAEAKVWQAIIVSSHAGATGGLSALSKVKRARDLLQQAERIDPDVLGGSVYTSLGSLYYQVPRWPLGFGNDKQADAYLKKALALNPNDIDANYFYGDYLLQQKHYIQAAEYLSRALQAPARPGRPIADAGRREDAQKALHIAKAKLTN